jgi:hypothetical protein
LKDELKSELSRLQSKLDEIKNGSAQTSADESKWSSEVIERIDN